MEIEFFNYYPHNLTVIKYKNLHLSKISTFNSPIYHNICCVVQNFWPNVKQLGLFTTIFVLVFKLKDVSWHHVYITYKYQLVNLCSVIIKLKSVLSGILKLL